jgi:hypothetical protein
MIARKSDLSLFCTFCGLDIGQEARCSRCGEINEFLDVTPPASVWTSGSPQEVVGGKRSGGIGRGPGAVARKVESPPPGVEERDVTAPLPREEDERTTPLSGKEVGLNPVVAILLCQDVPCSETLRYELREGESTVGRKEADIIVSGEHVSKKHAAIKVERMGGGQYRVLVMDCGSQNGTFVNDEGVEPKRPHRLKDKDIVKFANVRFLFRLGTPSGDSSAGEVKAEKAAPSGGPTEAAVP